MDYFRQFVVSFIAIVLAILFMVICSSCGGTRKVDISKNTSENINIENTYSIGEKIVLNDIFTYTPLDISKPMIVNGKSYQNAVIKSDKSVSKEKKIEIRTKYYITRTITIEKTIDRTNYIYLWLGMFLIVCGFIFLWFYLPKIKN